MKGKIRILQIIHLSICAAVVFLYILIGKISLETIENFRLDFMDLIYFLTPMAAILFSNFIFKIRLKEINPKQSFEDQFSVYQSASILRWGILEAGALAGLFLKPGLFLLGLIILIYLLFLRPTEEKIKNDIQKNIVV